VQTPWSDFRLLSFSRITRGVFAVQTVTETAGADEWITLFGNGDDFQFVNEGRVRPDIVARLAFVAEAEFRRNEDHPLGADSHLLQSVLPTLHSTVALGEKMLATVEFFAVDEIATVLDDDKIVGSWLVAGAFVDNSVLQPVG